MNTATRWQHGSVVKNPPAKAGDSGEAGLIPVGWDDPLEQKMATHSSILAWKIPWTEESSGLQSMGSQRVRHELVTEHASILPCKSSMKADSKATSNFALCRYTRAKSSSFEMRIPSNMAVCILSAVYPLLGLCTSRSTCP